MNAKISVIAICVEPIIYLLLYNLYGCTFNSDDDLLHKNIIVAKAVLYEDNKYYPKAFLDECLHKL